MECQGTSTQATLTFLFLNTLCSTVGSDTSDAPERLRGRVDLTIEQSDSDKSLQSYQCLKDLHQLQQVLITFSAVFGKSCQRQT